MPVRSGAQSMCGEPSPLSPPPFRTCGSCLRKWASWHEFVVDPEIHLLGLQAVPNLPDGNLRVFDHSCGTSISLPVRRIRRHLPDFEEEVRPPARLGLEECGRRCPSLEDLVACTRPCVKAADRHIVQLIVQLKQRAQ
jgi:hypothetical protein